jgi:hypothetical protein
MKIFFITIALSFLLYSNFGKAEVSDDFKTYLDEKICQPSGLIVDKKPSIASSILIKDYFPLLAAGSCCKKCKKSQPCGDSCISWSKTCHKPRGCAC